MTWDYPGDDWWAGTHTEDHRSVRWLRSLMYMAAWPEHGRGAWGGHSVGEYVYSLWVLQFRNWWGVDRQAGRHGRIDSVGLIQKFGWEVHISLVIMMFLFL